MILLTGGSGLLGQELQKYLDCDAPTHKELDITNLDSVKKFFKDKHYDLIIHCAAYTDVIGAEKNPIECADVNINGTFNLLLHTESPFVYISSEYAKNPVNFYAKTKEIAEYFVDCFSMGYEGVPSLIIRTSFCKNPWPYDNAFIDSWTKGDYIDIIAPMIAKAIKSWDRIHGNLIHVGTTRKRVYDIAIKSKPNVRPSSIKEIKDVRIPSDYL